MSTTLLDTARALNPNLGAEDAQRVADGLRRDLMKLVEDGDWHVNALRDPVFFGDDLTRAGLVEAKRIDLNSFQYEMAFRVTEAGRTALKNQRPLSITAPLPGWRRFENVATGAHLDFNPQDKGHCILLEFYSARDGWREITINTNTNK